MYVNREIATCPGNHSTGAGAGPGTAALLPLDAGRGRAGSDGCEQRTAGRTQGKKHRVGNASRRGFASPCTAVWTRCPSTAGYSLSDVWGRSRQQAGRVEHREQPGEPRHRRLRGGTRWLHTPHLPKIPPHRAGPSPGDVRSAAPHGGAQPSVWVRPALRCQRRCRGVRRCP